MVTEYSFNEVPSPVPSPYENLQASNYIVPWFSQLQNILSHIYNRRRTWTRIFLDNIEKEANFLNFNLTKIINKKIKLKTFKIDSSKRFSESLTWYKK